MTGSPSEEGPLFLFNGDFVDRGAWGVETLTLLLAWKVALPHLVYLVRGNHESAGCIKLYGFLQELLAKYGKADGKVRRRSGSARRDAAAITAKPSHLPFHGRTAGRTALVQAASPLQHSYTFKGHGTCMQCYEVHRRVTTLPRLGPATGVGSCCPLPTGNAAGSMPRRASTRRCVPCSPCYPWQPLSQTRRWCFMVVSQQHTCDGQLHLVVTHLWQLLPCVHDLLRCHNFRGAFHDLSAASCVAHHILSM